MVVGAPSRAGSADPLGWVPGARLCWIEEHQGTPFCDWSFVIGSWSFPRLFVEVVREQSGLMAVEYLDERAKRGSRKKFERATAKVRDLKPEERDA